MMEGFTTMSVTLLPRPLFARFRMMLVLLVMIAAILRSTTGSGGVHLYSELLGANLANNSLITSDDISGLRGAIICTRDNGTMDQNDGARWNSPAGQTIAASHSDVAGNTLFYTQIRPSGIHLFQGGRDLSSESEGVYSCHIEDNAGNQQVLLIGIYPPGSTGPPVIHGSPVISLRTNRTNHSSQFTINCPSTTFPPSSTSWQRDGQSLTITEQQSRVLVDAPSSSYDNLLRVDGNRAGEYRCVLRNEAGSRNASISVRVPSGPPSNVETEPGGRGTVLVTWTPPSGELNGYVIVYSPTASPSEETAVVVTDSAVTSHILEEIATETEYSVRMWAYLDLPSDISSPATIYLDVPGQPSNVIAMSTSSGTVEVRWDRPQSESNVEGYVVRYSPTGLCEVMEEGGVEVNGSETTEVEVSGMAAGTEYEVSVAAFNSVGLGDFSQPPVTIITAVASPNGVPLNVSVEPHPPDTLRVMWEPPDCLYWNSPSITGYTVSLTSAGSTSSSQEEVTVDGLEHQQTGLESFIVYTVSVSAVNEEGSGPPSDPLDITIITAPGPLETVDYEPDILSVRLKWDPPLKGRGYITMVILDYYDNNRRTTKLGTVNITDAETNLNTDTVVYRLAGLEPSSTYDLSFTAHTSYPAPGPARNLTVTTTSIGRVTSVKLSIVSSTAVNVSWTPLPSQDVSYYRITYWKLSESENDGGGRDGGKSDTESYTEVPVDRTQWKEGENGDGWAVVRKLEEGEEYRFSVAAVVEVDGSPRLGERAEPVAVTVEDLNVASEGDFDVIIVAAAVAGAVLLILVIVGLIIVMIVAWLFRRYRRSGKMEIASAMELRRSPKLVPHIVGAYDPPTSDLASSRPEVMDAPTDIIAVEGERVDFKLKVLGSPEPTVVWYHNGCMVGPDYATEIAKDGGLTLVSVEPHHEGTYRYTVSNRIGSIQGKVTLYVSTEATTSFGPGRLSSSSSSGGGRRMDLPTVTSALVSVDEFPRFVRENSENGSKGLRDQFLCLNSCEEGHSTSVALSTYNKRLNRFGNIVPYDDNRVKLKTLLGREDCQHDFINASYINGYGIAKKFVATQGPTDATQVDFWRMVWQLHSPTVVMVTNLEEGHKKCTQYWPNFGTTDYGPYSVTLASRKIRTDFTLRKLTLTSTFSTRRVHYVNHYQFTSWRDHQVPDSAFPLLEFHRRIIENHRPNKGPIVIHCSAGVGRTGAFILMDTALGQAGGEKRMDIPDILTRLRNQRMKMVQTPEQYIFVHKAVLERLTCRRTSIAVAQLEHSLAELETNDTRLGCTKLEEQFDRLQELSPGLEESTCLAARQFPHKNRSRDYLPTDQWRVPLKDERPGYIHASFASNHRRKEAFIIAQAPLDETCRDFWKMVHERECGAIVMLSGLVEDGRVTCQRYWPTYEVEMYGEYAVNFLGEEKLNSCIRRSFSVTNSKSGQVHYVTQYQVLGWTSEGKTNTPTAIIECMLNIEDVQRRSGDNPIVVHCSDSVTRSGIFCAAMAAIDCCQLDDTLDVFHIVRALRQQRPGALPLFQHYQLLHKLLFVFQETTNSNSSC